MRKTMTGTLLTLLQISDSAFPTGGFSHSLGLEATVRQGVTQNKGELQDFFVCCIENAGSFCLPFVKAAYDSCKDLERLKYLDNLCEACTGNHVAKRASVRQGKSMLETSYRAFDEKELLTLKETLKFAHHTVVFGSICCIMGIDEYSCLMAYMFNTLRTVIASAVRLDQLGPIEAQNMQTKLQSRIKNIIERNESRVVEDACMMCPVIDILQNTQDTMFSKLFYS